MVIRHVADNSDLVKSKKLNFYFQRKSRSVEFLGSFSFWRQLLQILRPTSLPNSHGMLYLKNDMM